jgi:hypothetical protein
MTVQAIKLHYQEQLQSFRTSLYEETLSDYRTSNQLNYHKLILGLHFLKNSEIIVAPEINFWAKNVLVLIQHQIIHIRCGMTKELRAKIGIGERNLLIMELPTNLAQSIFNKPESVLAQIVHALYCFKEYKQYYMHKLSLEQFYDYNLQTHIKSLKEQINFLHYCTYIDPQVHCFNELQSLNDALSHYQKP